MLRLTFDDGPSEWTPAILDLLAERDQKATFFVVGAAIQQHMETLRRIVAEGHRVGVHTFTHRRLTDLDAEQVRAEFRACSGLITIVCKETPALWRAPYFARDASIDKIAAAHGLVHVGADIIPDDWNMASSTEIAERVLAQTSPRAVVCLHDGMPPGGGNGTASRQATVDAVRLILEAQA